MQRKVTRIPAIMPAALRKKRVAAYARVSSDKEAMLHSLAAQVSYYSTLIQKHPDWEYAGVFSDEGMTGTKTDRPGFQTMIEACRAGKIDRIITKSISRFARNTVTLLETVRELKGLGISVFFEEQKTDSMTSQGELMLSLLASYAQEESRMASENRKWQIRKSFERGIVPPLTMNGYKVQNGELIVIPREAKVVKLIVHCYLSGMGRSAICRMLNELEIPAKRGGKWREHAIAYILSNEKYTGDLLLQKYIVIDHLTKKKIVNHGEMPQYFIRDDHEAILDRDTAEHIKTTMAHRAAIHPNGRGKEQQISCFSERVVCGICGKAYCRKVNHGIAIWKCTTYTHRGKEYCASKQIRENILIDEATKVLGLQTFHEQAFRERIREIRVFPDQRLLFLFCNGQTSENVWIERSRRESWTEEMRLEARQHVMRRYNK